MTKEKVFAECKRSSDKRYFEATNVRRAFRRIDEDRRSRPSRKARRLRISFDRLEKGSKPTFDEKGWIPELDGVQSIRKRDAPVDVPR